MYFKENDLVFPAHNQSKLNETKTKPQVDFNIFLFVLTIT